jgi:hypothetical protein
MPTKVAPQTSTRPEQEPSQDYINQGINAAEAFANKGGKSQPKRGGPARRYGQQFAGGAKGAVKGAVKGAAKEAAKEGVKGAAKGAMKGARAGAQAGSVVPVVGTAIGGALGGIGGAIGGGALGAAKGAGKGAVKGAQEGARDGINKVRDKQRAQDQGKKDTGLIKKGFNNLAKKGMAAAGKQAGRATGIGDAKEQAKDIKALASGSMKEKARAAVNTANRVAANGAALAAMGNKELSPIFQKALETLESKKFWRNMIFLLIAIGLIIFIMFDASAIDPDQNVDITSSETCVPAQFTGDAFGKTAVCTITVTSQGMA